MVIKDFLVYCRQEMKNDPWDDEGSIGDFEEQGHEGGLPTAQCAEADDAAGCSDFSGSNVFGECNVGSGENGNAGEAEDDDDNTSGGAPRQRYWRRESRLIEAVLDPKRMRELTEEWHEQCAVCKVTGKIARGHWHWTECSRAHAEKGRISEAIKALEDVQFASFAHCRWCYRSQAVCEIWARSVNWQGRVVFKKKPGGRLQIREVGVGSCGNISSFRGGRRS